MDQWCESRNMRGGMEKELWYRDDQLGDVDKEVEEERREYCFEAGGIELTRWN